jgi:hypothetical protein
MQGGIEVETGYLSPCVAPLVLAASYLRIYSYISHKDVPHVATEDHAYNGLFIPKGARDITKQNGFLIDI